MGNRCGYGAVENRVGKRLTVCGKDAVSFPCTVNLLSMLLSMAQCRLSIYPCPGKKKGEELKRLKSYTDIWNVEHVLYGLNDLKLPFPVTYSQIAWFVIALMLALFLNKYPPLCMIENELLKYLVVPFAFTWLMSRKTFDGKKPYRFFLSVFTYAVRPKESWCGKRVTYRKRVYDEKITIVRCYKYVSN